MSETNIIKSIVNQTCPHCKGEIFIESQMTPPTIASVFTQEAVDAAKKDCLARLDTLSIPDEKKLAVKKWLENSDTIFSGNEVESIILSLLKPE